MAIDVGVISDEKQYKNKEFMVIFFLDHLVLLWVI